MKINYVVFSNFGFGNYEKKFSTLIKAKTFGKTLKGAYKIYKEREEIVLTRQEVSK